VYGNSDVKEHSFKYCSFKLTVCNKEEDKGSSAWVERDRRWPVQEGVDGVRREGIVSYIYEGCFNC